MAVRSRSLGAAPDRSCRATWTASSGTGVTVAPQVEVCRSRCRQPSSPLLLYGFFLEILDIQEQRGVALRAAPEMAKGRFSASLRSALYKSSGDTTAAGHLVFCPSPPACALPIQEQRGCFGFCHPPPASARRCLGAPVPRTGGPPGLARKDFPGDRRGFYAARTVNPTSRARRLGMDVREPPKEMLPEIAPGDPLQHHPEQGRRSAARRITPCREVGRWVRMPNPTGRPSLIAN